MVGLLAERSMPRAVIGHSWRDTPLEQYRPAACGGSACHDRHLAPLVALAALRLHRAFLCDLYIFKDYSTPTASVLILSFFFKNRLDLPAGTAQQGAGFGRRTSAGTAEIRAQYSAPAELYPPNLPPAAIPFRLPTTLLHNAPGGALSAIPPGSTPSDNPLTTTRTTGIKENHDE
jgi:hypothetical protein